jgi:hypothetical protein
MIVETGSNSGANGMTPGSPVRAVPSSGGSDRPTMGVRRLTEQKGAKKALRRSHG